MKKKEVIQLSIAYIILLAYFIAFCVLMTKRSGGVQ